MPNARKLSNGSWALTVHHNDKRHQITLGKIDKGQAKVYASMITLLLDQYKYAKGMAPQVATFIEGMPQTIISRLAEIGLIPKVDIGRTIGELIDEYLREYEAREDRELSTKKRLRCSLKRFPKWVREKRSKSSAT